LITSDDNTALQSDSTLLASFITSSFLEIASPLPQPTSIVFPPKKSRTLQVPSHLLLRPPTMLSSLRESLLFAFLTRLVVRSLSFLLCHFRTPFKI